MSIKVALKFEEFQVTKLAKKLPEAGKFTRLFCSIKFKTEGGWYGSAHDLDTAGYVE